MTQTVNDARELVSRIKEHAEALLALIEFGETRSGASDARSTTITDESLAALRSALLFLSGADGSEGRCGRLVRSVEVGCESLREEGGDMSAKLVTDAVRASIEALGEFCPDLASVLLASPTAMASMNLAVTSRMAGSPMLPSDGQDEHPAELAKIPRCASTPWLVHVSDATAAVGDRIAPGTLDRKSRAWRKRHPEEA